MTLASEALAIARAGVRAVDPALGVRRTLRRRQGGWAIGGRRLAPGPGGSVALVAIGKAGARMAEAALAITGPDTRGIVAVPRGYPRPGSGLRTVVGEHPIPGSGSFRAGAAVLDFVGRLGPDDLLVFLLSGGGSAVAEVPSSPLTGGEIAHTTRLLLASGAPIGAMNTIRRHLSAFKGGRLALAAGTRRCATLALSDVVGDAPEEIASGPTVPDPTTFRDAWSAAHRYRLLARLPPAVRRHLDLGRRGSLSETAKPGDPGLRGASFALVGSNRTAVEAAAREASARGFAPRVVARPIVGETAPAGRAFARSLLRIPRTAARGRLAFLGGGETTVTLGRHPGRGGRNLEFALAGAAVLRGRAAVVASVGTDGVDGPTDVAGGWVDGRTLDRAARIGLAIDDALRRHDSLRAVARVGGLVRTGPTGTNVMDLHVGLVARTSPHRAGSPSSRSGARRRAVQPSVRYGRK